MRTSLLSLLALSACLLGACRGPSRSSTSPAAADPTPVQRAITTDSRAAQRAFDR